LFTQTINYNFWAIYLDEGYRLYPSLRLLRGEELFRDMFTAYPPLSFYLHEIAYALLGVKVSSVRIVLICSQLATTLCTYALARYLMNRWFALFAALLTISYGIVNHNMGYSGWYVVPFMLSAMLFLFHWIRSDCANRRELLGVD
jgi:4-amino-4-deoxy-L-arabinose transferase-like glycosyltransferase